jgi:cysteinyl-tRNA synthetase
MSKSSGGFLTLQRLIDMGYDPLDYRYFLLGAHYRSQLQFSNESMDSAQAARRSLGERMLALKEKAGSLPLPAPSELGPSARGYLDNFAAALAQDLATPRALAELWGLLRDARVEPGQALAAAYDMDRVLGLGFEALERQAATETDPALAAEIDALVAERSTAKKAKNFARADAIRTELKARGVILEDGPSGTTWRRA